jgi:hypothetical protein
MQNLDEIPQISIVRNAIENLNKFDFPKFNENTLIENYVESVIKNCTQNLDLH